MSITNKKNIFRLGLMSNHLKNKRIWGKKTILKPFGVGNSNNIENRRRIYRFLFNFAHLKRFWTCQKFRLGFQHSVKYNFFDSFSSFLCNFARTFLIFNVNWLGNWDWKSCIKKKEIDFSVSFHSMKQV